MGRNSERYVSRTTGTDRPHKTESLIRILSSQFGGAILETTFKEQAEKWENLVLSHVSRVIVVVHDFIVKVLQATITDKTVREALWEDVLFERLCQTYQRAMLVPLT